MKTRTMFVSISQRMAWHSNGIQMFNRSVGKNISKKQSMLVMIIFLSSYGGDSRKQIRTYELQM